MTKTNLKDWLPNGVYGKQTKLKDWYPSCAWGEQQVIATESVCGSDIYYVTVNVPKSGSVDWQYVYSYPNATQTISYPQTVTYQPIVYQNTPTINWYNSLAGVGGQWASSVYWRDMEPLTPEDMAKMTAKLAEQDAKRKAAEQRAEHLLFSILTPAQVKQYTDDDHFEVPVGDRLYRLKKGRSMNVELIEAGKATIKFCAHPHNAYDLPVPDVMLSQLLALRANEAGFLAVANRTVLQ